MAAMGAMAPPAPPGTPPATTQWRIARIDTHCAVFGRFGTAPNQVLLGVEPALVGDGAATIVVASDQAAMDRRSGRAQLALDDQTIEHAHFTSYGLTQPRTRLMLVDADDLAPDAVRGARAVRVEADGLVLRLSLAGLAASWSALDQCLAARRAELHLDPALFAPAVPARPIAPSNWIWADDFPARPLAAGQSGVSEILWTIGVDGRVSDCRVVASDGGPDFDAAACHAITTRGRYRPARDAAGHAVQSYGFRRIIWNAPS